MAENEDTAHLEALRSLRELFGGRFTDAEMSTLYEYQERDKMATAVYILETNPSQADVEQLSRQEQENWVLIKTRRSLRRDIVDRVRSGEIDTAVRQFACGPCDSAWWRKVPGRKQVSTCRLCKERYDPVPKDKEWGWAVFTCTNQLCGKEFRGFSQMGTPSPCYQCGQPVFPTYILPPNRGQGRIRRSDNVHACAICQPGNGVPGEHARHQVPLHRGRGRGSYGGGGGIHYFGGQTVIQCAHPYNRRLHNLPKVMHASKQHDSTGSTVDTFLPQSNFDESPYQVYLETIPEERPGSGE